MHFKVTKKVLWTFIATNRVHSKVNASGNNRYNYDPYPVSWNAPSYKRTTFELDPEAPWAHWVTSYSRSFGRLFCGNDLGSRRPLGKCRVSLAHQQNRANSYSSRLADYVTYTSGLSPLRSRPKLFTHFFCIKMKATGCGLQEYLQKIITVAAKETEEGDLNPNLQQNILLKILKLT